MNAKRATIDVAINNWCGGDLIVTRWRREGGSFVPSGRAVRHYVDVVGATWAAVRPLGDELRVDRAARIMDRAADVYMRLREGGAR